MKSVADPVAIEILTSLALEPATSAEVGERLRLGPEVARAHIRRLADRGHLVVGERVTWRGNLENLYLADPRATVLDPADLIGLPRSSVAAAELALARWMFREAAAASASGIIGRRLDSTLTRYLIPVDDVGFVAAQGVHRRLFGDVVEEAARARSRIERRGAKSIATSVQILCFDYPLERWSLPPGQATVRRKPGADHIERVFELSVDPLRTSIIQLLCIFAASAGTLAKQLGVPSEKVRYELDRLAAEGILRIVGTRSNRGAEERIFVLDLRAVTFTTNDLEAAEVRTDAAWDSWVVRSVFTAALGSIAAAPAGDDESGPYLGRIVTALDEEGFARIATLTEGAIRELFDLRSESLRARPSGKLPDRVIFSGLLAFERAAPTRR